MSAGAHERAGEPFADVFGSGRGLTDEVAAQAATITDELQVLAHWHVRRISAHLGEVFALDPQQLDELVTDEQLRQFVLREVLDTARRFPTGISSSLCASDAHDGAERALGAVLAEHTEFSKQMLTLLLEQKNAPDGLTLADVPVTAAAMTKLLGWFGVYNQTNLTVDETLSSLSRSIGKLK